MDHAVIRRRMLDRRRALSVEAVNQASALVVERVRSLPAYAGATLVASYMSLDGEIDPAELLQGKSPQVALPVTRAAEPLRFVVPDGPLELGSFGIREPTTGRVVEPTELEVVLVPLVAVDWLGNRLGHGAGYYDRTFAFRRDRNHPVLIGLAHQFQVVESIKPSPWDVPVDLIVTETGIFGRGVAPSTFPMGED
ncbi:MAG: 5-formyltetrahydrofolate cyclo-ligase [Actinomycetota bacterium]|nr:5-formyltetrahydrofolate cyclo-ligase [Actinomycetota bacterium]